MITRLLRPLYDMIADLLDRLDALHKDVRKVRKQLHGMEAIVEEARDLHDETIRQRKAALAAEARARRIAAANGAVAGEEEPDGPEELRLPFEGEDDAGVEPNGAGLDLAAASLNAMFGRGRR